MTIWPQVATTVALAAIAGGLAVPASRRLVFGDIRHDWLADELPFDRIDPDGLTVRDKDGGLSRVYHLRGVSYDAKEDQEQAVLLEGRSSLFHLLAGKGVTVRLFGVKRRRDLSFEAVWPSKSLAEIAAAEARRYRSSYYVDWFMVLSAPAMGPLLAACNAVQATTGSYQPSLVMQSERPDAPCPLTGFLNYLVCGEFRHDLPAISRSISGSLPASDVHFEKESGLVRAFVPHEKVHQIIAVSEWPDLVSGRLVGEILALPGDLEVFQVMEPWDRDKAIGMYKRREREARFSLIGNPTMAAECGELLAALTGGSSSLFATQMQITVRADDRDELRELIDAVCEILGRCRVIHSVETSAAPFDWFLRMPTPSRSVLLPGGKMMRPLHLIDHNVAALWPFNHSCVGRSSSPFGPLPIRYFPTPSGQTFAFQFHVREKPRESLGNFLVFAPSGSGKSTMILHLLGGMAKFADTRSYLFDSKEGARYMVEVLGGVYQGYEDLALNPLDVGSDTPAARHWVYSILRAMCGDHRIDEDDDVSLHHAVELAFKLDPPHRTLNNLFAYAFPKRTPLARVLSKWVRDDEKGAAGLLAHIFNAPHDTLSSVLSSSFLVGINMNEALDDPVLGPPIVAHVAEAIGRTAKVEGKGFAIFIDEAAALLRNPGFLSFAAEMYREIRKRFGLIGMAFQDPKALLNTGQADAFLDNTATMIFFPNSQARPETLAPFNLNSEQVSFVMGAQPGKGRRVLVVQRDAATGLDESAIVDVDLSPLGDETLRFYRAGDAANRDLANLKTQWGEQWRDRL